MENRVVIFAPTGRDARLISQVLERAGVESHICSRMIEVVDELVQGVGVLLLVDEALDTPLTRPLTQYLSQQPAWSDLPIFLLSNRGLNSPEIRSAYQHLGNVTLLERPLHGITLVSAATSALRARKRQYAMREVDRRKDEFLAMLAHELRNPLAPISAASDLLKLPSLDREKIKQTSEIISRQVRHMTGLIDDLLDVSRVSRGLVPLEKQSVDTRLITASAVEQVRPLIDGRRHSLTLRTSPHSAFVEGDPKRLVQILANVLNNAAKYTPEGGEILLATDVSESAVIFTVSDNGIGIAPEVIGRIFDLFAQAERTSDRTQGGLGIGLALVKSLIQLHGGTVTASSDGASTGAEFQLTFPRHFPVEEESLAADAIADKLINQQRLLVVDDNVDAANMLGMFLELAGHQVKIVHTAAAALEAAARADSIDACLLDIGLPDLDGIGLAKRLREIPSTKKTLLIAITGYGQEQDRHKTSRAGFNHHYVKPIDMEQLISTLAGNETSNQITSR